MKLGGDIPSLRVSNLSLFFSLAFGLLFSLSLGFFFGFSFSHDIFSLSVESLSVRKNFLRTVGSQTVHKPLSVLPLKAGETLKLGGYFLSLHVSNLSLFFSLAFSLLFIFGFYTLCYGVSFSRLFENQVKSTWSRSQTIYISDTIFICKIRKFLKFGRKCLNILFKFLFSFFFLSLVKSCLFILKSHFFTTNNFNVCIYKLFN